MGFATVQSFHGLIYEPSPLFLNSVVFFLWQNQISVAFPKQPASNSWAPGPSQRKVTLLHPQEQSWGGKGRGSCSLEHRRLESQGQVSRDQSWGSDLRGQGLLFLLPLAVRPAGRSFQKHRAPSLTSYSLSSLSHDTRRVLGRQSFMRSHFQSVQFCKCPRTCAVGRKWFKENQQLFCGGLVSGASWGPLSDLPWGVQLGGVRVWGACENQKKANEAAQAAASPGGERGSGCGHVEGGT